MLQTKSWAVTVQVFPPIRKETNFWHQTQGSAIQSLIMGSYTNWHKAN